MSEASDRIRTHVVRNLDSDRRRRLANAIAEHFAESSVMEEGAFDEILDSVISADYDNEDGETEGPDDTDRCITVNVSNSAPAASFTAEGFQRLINTVLRTGQAALVDDVAIVPASEFRRLVADPVVTVSDAHAGEARRVAQAFADAVSGVVKGLS